MTKIRNLVFVVLVLISISISAYADIANPIYRSSGISIFLLIGIAIIVCVVIVISKKNR